MKRWILGFSAAVVGCWAATGQSVANASESWPSRPIKWVVPYPPGGTTDMLARIVGAKLSERLGQPVVIENKPGAGGDVGTAYVAKQPADGYTIVMGNIGPIAINPTLTPDARFSPTRDLAPVTLLAEVPNLLVVNPQLPVKSVKELVQYAKQQPNPLSYATPGNGTSLHLAGELFASTAGLRMVHVPYRGSGPGLNDTMAGHVPIMFDNMPSALNLVKGGKVRALAITSAVRSPLLPDVPTMTEAGLSNYQITGWFGVLVPAATPKPIVTRLDAEIQAVLKMPDVRSKIGDIGGIISGAGRDEFGRFIQQESAKWQKLIRTAHITVQ
ncbi:tripartite tricarboxylate transporter substrate binding protein [Cupriavidus taiwanensis]|jgi:tripartite-type tricarboxylate transporter receptor subunit TctC|uniref:Tripartite tricarboxylate transporter substrate binding protein n=6 Tax=root TaxID=1 RepID=A0AAE9I858_9BURK|nr:MULTISPECIES: tripartite tricarboxylate transporter substrate binding protein [Cupriavidus]QDL89536.1 lacI family transciptional regulator tricarboxylate transport protein tctC [Sym plasmid]AMR78283.1 LacI family transcriptional regulator [Cupriavidus nantongensis]AZG14433.1 tripartite tricarboxylate transporter substrate binding protein [Cupriavidus pauculus]MBU67556.1 tripartite tricarboxylate transporter substrate binding protein [Cupriavidus sp.]MBY4732119.1 tripartite tricarboxylate tr